jgi:SAM-dependent methyltransferase
VTLHSIYRIAMYRELLPFLQSVLTPTSRVAEISGDSLRGKLGLSTPVEELRRPDFDLMGAESGPPRYDLVFADQVLEHVPDPQWAVDHVRALLRPGGWACLTTVFLFPLHEDLPETEDYWRFTPRALRRLFGAWSDVHVGGWGHELAVNRALHWSENDRSTTIAEELLALPNDPRFPVVVWVYGRRP